MDSGINQWQVPMEQKVRYCLVISRIVCGRALRKSVDEVVCSCWLTPEMFAHTTILVANKADRVRLTP
jgi:hypothetical protein